MEYIIYTLVILNGIIKKREFFNYSGSKHRVLNKPIPLTGGLFLLFLLF